jgi:hypothetical protein
MSFDNPPQTKEGFKNLEDLIREIEATPEGRDQMQAARNRLKERLRIKENGLKNVRILQTLRNSVEDPMWEGHTEMPKEFLRQVIQLIEDQNSDLNTFHEMLERALVMSGKQFPSDLRESAEIFVHQFSVKSGKIGGGLSLESFEEDSENEVENEATSKTSLFSPFHSTKKVWTLQDLIDSIENVCSNRGPIQNPYSAKLRTHKFTLIGHETRPGRNCLVLSAEIEKSEELEKARDFLNSLKNGVFVEEVSGNMETIQVQEDWWVLVKRGDEFFHVCGFELNLHSSEISQFGLVLSPV